MKTILEVRNLEKSFKENKALKGVSFDIHEGEILCLLGPNGAGKSTTINILSTALRPDGGEISFNGKKVQGSDRHYKEHLGIIPQDLAVYEELSAESNVGFFASLYGLKGKVLEERITEALEFVGLNDKRKDKVKTFSGGMKRRLNIACAIAHHPKIVIMDEPTVGIDPQSRNHILSAIKELRNSGVTILYTTHYMEEVEEISSRIIIIDHGTIIAQGTNEQLKESLEHEKLYSLDVEEIRNIKQDDFYAIEGVKSIGMENNRIRIVTLKGVENLDKLISIVINRGMKINRLACQEVSLESVFLSLTGRSLRD